MKPLDVLFRPRSVAVIGASDDPARISGRPIRYLREGGFQGTVFPVNPSRDRVQGLRSYPAVKALPEVPDVALVAVAATHARDAVEQCAASGVGAVVLFSAGYAETGEAGARLQDEIVAIARSVGMRILGPNCLGLFCADIGFYGTFANALDGGLPVPGPLAIVSQSGAYGAHVAYLARRRGLGVRYCVTTGNEADVDFAESLHWLARRTDVEVLVAYAEGVRDGAMLVEALRIAREYRKPVVFLKVGRSSVGARAVGSHTAALAGADAVYEGVFRQFGVHRAGSTEEQLDVAYACARGIFPAGNRLGIVTVSGGAGVQMCDAAERVGLDVSPMPAAAQQRLKQILPYAAVANPVDATAQALNDMSVLARNLEIMLDEGGYDALLGFFTTVPAARPFAAPLRQAIAQGTRNHRDRLIVLCMVADEDIVRSYEEAGFLVFEDADRAVSAIGALAKLRAAFARPPGPSASRAATDAGDAGGSLAHARERQRSGSHSGSDEIATLLLDRGASPLSEPEAKRILASAGMPVLPEAIAGSASEAVGAANRLGYPVAMKIVSPDIAHKTEIGGVALGVADDDGVRGTFESLLDRARIASPGARIDGVLVSPMAPPGVDLIVGVNRDSTFGPVVMVGIGGVLVEVMRDVSFRVAPFDEAEAMRMIDDLAMRAILSGVRGSPRSDVGALAFALALVSRFAADHAGRIESLDINPLRVLPEGRGCVALDALIVPASPDGVAMPPAAADDDRLTGDSG